MLMNTLHMRVILEQGEVDFVIYRMETVEV